MSTLLEFVETTKIAPRFFFKSAAAGEAVDRLVGSLDAGARVTALIGEPGLGKTLTLSALTERVQADRAVATITGPRLSGAPLIQLASVKFGARGGSEAAPALRRRLRAVGAGRRPALLLIDDADALDPTAIAYLLAEARDPKTGADFIQIVLAGGVELEKRLRSPSAMEAITVDQWARLSTLTADQSRAFIQEWLEAAGRLPVDVVTPAALDRLALRSGGSPQKLNALCFQALHLAARSGQSSVAFETVEEAARQALRAESAAPRLPGEAAPADDTPQIARRPFVRETRVRADAETPNRFSADALKQRLRDRFSVLVVLGATSALLGAAATSFAATVIADPAIAYAAAPSALRAPPEPKLGATSSAPVVISLAPPLLPPPILLVTPPHRPADDAAADVRTAKWIGLEPANAEASNARALLDPRTSLGRETARRLGLSALMQAALAGDAITVEAALQGGATDVDAIDVLGRTALHYAVLGGETDVVKRLVQAGAKIDAATVGGVTPLDAAIGLDRSGIVALLQAAGG
ncbi:MAG: AAA family ATPase [Pseudomonadota bacterium]